MVEEEMSDDRAFGPSAFENGKVPISDDELGVIIEDMLTLLMERVDKVCGVELVEEDAMIDDINNKIHEWFEKFFTITPPETNFNP
jgi:hypothetical protein